ncbi:MAG: glycoside hydrolase family 127 protein [Bacteroidota bacterium]|nr:glycoside hydrolase family 127 protein [Bacteroidota bacterium]
MKKNYLLTILLLSFPVHLLVNAQSHYPGQHQGKMMMTDKTPMKAYSFDLQNVRLLPGMFRDNMERESVWILSIDTKRLLHSFRSNAGVYSENEGGYFVMKKLGGWESLDCDLRGHTTGHILSGLAMLYGSTGNEAYKLKADSLVKGLAEVQKALHQNGYLSAFPQGLIDRNIAGQRVWAPWYTLHKIYAGLIDQYLYCDNKLALEVVEKMADWAYQKLKPLSAEERAKMLRNEFGGMNDVFYNIYAISGKPEYQWLAGFFYHDEMLNPLLKKEDILEKKHANTFIPKLIGLTRNYEIDGNDTSKQVAKFFWNTVIDHHTFCTGSNSDKEKFFKPDNLSAHLTGYTGESCNVYNLLKLTRHLFCAEADVKYADYYERALYNHILGQQDPETGMIAYFLPMLPGAHKVYSTRDSSFWCCVGTGFENQAKYGEAIYFHTDKALYVNLFIASELNWKEKGVKVRQETQFPNTDKTTLTIETSQNIEMPVLVRYPAWAISGAVVKINGKLVKVAQKPGSYIVLNRKWDNDDKIEVTYPMKLRAVPSDNDSVVAFTYGPIVLAGVMGTEGMVAPAPFSNPKLYNDYYTYDFHVPATLIHTLKLDKSNVDQFIKPVIGGKPLTFKTENEGVTLEPLYQIHHQRYVVYWNLK